MQQAVGLGELLDYLGSLGHREVGYLGDGSPANARRKTVLQQEMRRRGMTVRGKWFVHAAHAGPEAGAEAVARLLAAGVDALPTAVVAADDVLAQSAMRALFERGCRVPHDVSLAGVDDIPSARMMIPALTTVRQPMADMVQQAFALVTQGGPWLSGRVVDVAPDLVVRESCGAPAERRRR